MKRDVLSCRKPFWGLPEFASHSWRITSLRSFNLFARTQLGLSYRFLAIKRCAFYNSNCRGKAWSSVADNPSVPLLPRTRAASKTNQGKRISSHLHLHLEERPEGGETGRGS